MARCYVMMMVCCWLSSDDSSHRKRGQLTRSSAQKIRDNPSNGVAIGLAWLEKITGKGDKLHGKYNSPIMMFLEITDRGRREKRTRRLFWCGDILRLKNRFDYYCDAWPGFLSWSKQRIVPSDFRENLWGINSKISLHHPRTHAHESYK